MKENKTPVAPVTASAAPGLSPPAFSLSEPEPAVIQPQREPDEEPVPSTVILTFTRPDYQALGRAAQVEEPGRQIWGCSYRIGTWQGLPLTVVAPAVGAPYAAMVLEKLIALGARRVLILGWCGSLSPRARIGSLILPDKALPGDGTSPHYCGAAPEIFPHPGLFNLLKSGLMATEVPWLSGPIWSTDAFYRETPGLVGACQSRGVLGLDLELAALLAVARFRGVAAAGALVVSDELFTLTWQPAKGSQPFRAARQAAVRLMLDTAAAAEGLDV
ncbi:MAG: nucleoside phosphorylase [Desulfobaccales bacterium]